MKKALTLANVLEELKAFVDEGCDRQILDPQHRDHGGVVRPEWGVPSAGSACAFACACAVLRLSGQYSEQAAQPYLHRANLALAYLLNVQRPSGNIDLLDTNYDSGPDTGFVLQALCAVLELARTRPPDSTPEWRHFLDLAERFTRKAAIGVRDGGFHTPNHRWVITSALAQAHALYPDLPVGETIDAYLAEGIDINAEGTYAERSAGVYDTVNNRSILLTAEFWNRPDLVPLVRRNLEFNLHMLNADRTVETGLSRRQDYGTAPVPVPLASVYLHYLHHQPEPVFWQAAQEIWAQAAADPAALRGEARGGSLWLAYHLLRDGLPGLAPAALPDSFNRHFPVNGLWRVRRGLLSASFFQGVTRLMNMRFGQAEVSSLKIMQCYYGAPGKFYGDSLTVEDGVGLFRSEGNHTPHRPGYELPLGRLVPPEQVYAAYAERDYTPQPCNTSTLLVREIEGGFALHYQTLDGVDRVTTQIMIDFPPGGVWETQDCAVQPQAGQVIILKAGMGRMRYGNDVIEIGPGAYAHSMWAMRHAEPAPAHVRVLFTFTTPVDHAFVLRGKRGW